MGYKRSEKLRIQTEQKGPSGQFAAHSPRLLRALSREARKHVRGESLLQRQLGEGSGRNCMSKHDSKYCTGDKVTKEHSAESACLGRTLLQGTWGPGRQQDEHETAESHCSTKRKSAPGLHVQGHHWKYRDVLQYSVLVRLHPE